MNTNTVKDKIRYIFSNTIVQFIINDLEVSKRNKWFTAKHCKENEIELELCFLADREYME
jgi:hypothetical protein